MAWTEPQEVLAPASGGLAPPDQCGAGGGEVPQGVAPTSTTLCPTLTHQQLYLSSAASSAQQEFLSEDTDIRLQGGGMLESVSEGRSTAAARGDVPTINVTRVMQGSSYASEIDMGPNASMASNDDAGAPGGLRGSRARGTMPAMPGQNRKVVMGSAQADVVTYTALSDDGSCEDSANLRPPAPLYYGGDLTVGSLPSMPELDEQAAGEDQSDVCYAQLSGAQMNMLIETLTKATAAAAHDAINRQFATLMPQFAQAQAAARDPAGVPEQPTGKAESKDVSNGSESGCSSAGGSLSDCCDMRSLESIVAQSILERHGLSEGSDANSASGYTSRSRWGSVRSVPSSGSRVRAPRWRSADPRLERLEAGTMAAPTQEARPMQDIIGPGIVPAAQEADRFSPPATVTDSQRQRCQAPAATLSSGSLPELLVKTRLQMVRDRVHELTGELVSDPGDDGHVPQRLPSEHRASREVPPMFKVCGFVPWSAARWPIASRMYRFGLLAFGLVLLGGLIVDTAQVRNDAWTAKPTCHSTVSGSCWLQRGLFSVFPLALSVVGTVALSCVLPQADDVGKTMSMLTAYMHNHELMERLRSRTVRDAWPTVFTWVLLLFTTCLGVGLDGYAGPPDVFAYTYLVSIVLVGFFAASLTFCMLHIARALSAMIDRFCCELAAGGDIAQAMRDWNVLQAVMLKASSSIEWIFVGMLLAVAFAVPLTLVDLLMLGAQWTALPPVVPGVLIMSLFVRAFLVAASITDKCGRVPALVNSLCFGPGSEAMKKATPAMKSMKKAAAALTKGALAQAIADATELKKSEVLSVLGSLASVAETEVKKTGKFTIPGVCMVKTRKKPATKAGKREMFGKMVVVKAKPAKTVVKAFAVAALKKAV